MPPTGYILFGWLIVFTTIRISLQDPVITSISPEQIKDIGDSVQLNCSVENAKDFSVAWSKGHQDRTDNVVIAMRKFLSIKDPRFEIEENIVGSTTHYSLKINKIEATDMGLYVCQVITSTSNTIKSTVALLVKHSPIILDANTTTLVHVAEGTPARLFCVAEGYPRPSISWRREHNAIMPNGGHRFSGSELYLKSSHRADRGTYYCIANNGVGEPDEKLVSLEIEFAPSIKTPRPKVAQAIDYDIELECKVEAYPAPAVVWYKDGSPLISNDHYRITHIATAFEITNSVVHISSVDKYSFGDYFCNATNKMGHADARINLFESILPVLSSHVGSKYD